MSLIFTHVTLGWRGRSEFTVVITTPPSLAPHHPPLEHCRTRRILRHSKKQPLFPSFWLRPSRHIASFKRCGERAASGRHTSSNYPSNNTTAKDAANGERQRSCRGGRVFYFCRLSKIRTTSHFDDRDVISRHFWMSDGALHAGLSMHITLWEVANNSRRLRWQDWSKQFWRHSRMSVIVRVSSTNCMMILYAYPSPWIRCKQQPLIEISNKLNHGSRQLRCEREATN